MKIILLTILAIQLSFSSSAQTEDSNWSIGITSKVDVHKTDTHRWFLFSNNGVALQRSFSDRWKMNINSLISPRKYNSTVASVTETSGFMITQLITAKEILFDFENNITYSLNNRKVSPFIGLGYSIQIPVNAKGEVFSNGINLTIPEDLKPDVKFGLHVLTGIQFKVGQKLSLLTSLEYKYFANSNADIYQYEISRDYTTLSGISRPRKDVDNNYLFSLGLLYKLKKK